MAQLRTFYIESGIPKEVEGEKGSKGDKGKGGDKPAGYT